MSSSTVQHLVVASALMFGCGETKAPISADAPAVQIDAPTGPTVTLPRWALEDVQPASPRAGQTYSLDSFTQKIIVVSLLEGF